MFKHRKYFEPQGCSQRRIFIIAEGEKEWVIHFFPPALGSAVTGINVVCLTSMTKQSLPDLSNYSQSGDCKTRQSGSKFSRDSKGANGLKSGVSSHYLHLPVLGVILSYIPEPQQDV